MSCAVHEGLCARVRMHVRGWGVTSGSAGVVGSEFEVEGVAGAAACLLLVAVPHSSSPSSRGAAAACVLEVEGVPSTAACSLLMLSILFSSPSSRAADAACASCSAVWWVCTSTLRLGLLSSHARVSWTHSRSVRLGLSAACSPHRVVRRSTSSSSAPRATGV